MGEQTFNQGGFSNLIEGCSIPQYGQAVAVPEIEYVSLI